MPKNHIKNENNNQSKTKSIMKQQAKNNNDKNRSNNEAKAQNINKNGYNIKDSRFKAAKYDPRFKPVQKNMGKVKIDKRFADKLESQDFKVSGTIDKYGRKQVENRELAGMSDYYYTQDQNNHKEQKQQIIKNKNKIKKNKDQQDINQDKTQKIKQNKDINKNKQKKSKKTSPTLQQQDQSQILQQNRISKWMQDYNVQSSSQQQNADQQQQNEQIVDEEQENDIWSDDDEQVVKGQDVQITKRLALCNYDWMNIGAKDLMLLFSSFKTNTGTVLDVKVYYSQIGRQKMQLQQKYGPQGIWDQQQQIKQKQKQQKRNAKYTSSRMKKAQQQAFNQVKLRKYEKQRLKYCYAIIQCNSAKTADEIYKQCDGNQFQSSNILFDLRFVPDDTKFGKQMLKQKCDQVPTKGEVKNFVSRALGHSHVGLTWEDPELNQVSGLKRKNWDKMTDKQMENIDWGIYLNEQNQNANENYNKIIKNNNKSQIDQQQSDGQGQQLNNVSDWRRQSDKRFRKNNDDDIMISFPSGFDSGPKKKIQKPSLNSQMKQVKSRKQRWRQNKQQKQQKRRQQMQLLVEKDNKPQFKYNPDDQRFKAVLENSNYYIDPSNSKFDHKKVGAVFQHVLKQNKKKNLQ